MQNLRDNWWAGRPNGTNKTLKNCNVVLQGLKGSHDYKYLRWIVEATYCFEVYYKAWDCLSSDEFCFLRYRWLTKVRIRLGALGEEFRTSQCYWREIAPFNTLTSKVFRTEIGHKMGKDFLPKPMRRYIQPDKGHIKLKKKCFAYKIICFFASHFKSEVI